MHWRAVRFDARSLTLESEPLAPRAGLAAWAERRAATRAVDWNYSWAPKLETAPGQLVALAVGINEMCHAVDVDHAHVLLGADFNIYRFCSADGAPAGLRPIAEGAYRVKQSPDGRLAVAALFDGTVRWFRLDDGLEELLAVFVTDEPSPRWVAFTPDGYYAAGVGAEDLIGWHLDRGPGRGADFFPASTFRDRFHRPDVVKRVLATRSRWRRCGRRIRRAAARSLRRRRSKSRRCARTSPPSSPSWHRARARCCPPMVPLSSPPRCAPSRRSG
jgi:hypothetical protein